MERLGLPVVVLGKGASAREVPASDRYRVAAVSEACRLAERVDWLGVNDVPAVERMTDDDFARCLNVVVPTELHVDTRGRVRKPWRECVRWTCPSIVYRLHTDPHSYRDIPYFGRQMSTAESLVSLLIHFGVRRFVLCGVGKGNDYHPMFVPRTLKRTPNHFALNYKRIVRRIKACGGELVSPSRVFR